MPSESACESGPEAVPQVVNMDCKHFDSILDDLERDTSMPPRAREQALQHAEDCAYCRARLTAARLLSLELGALAKNDESQQAPARIEAILLAAFSERPQRHSWLWRSLGWAGAAATVAIAAWSLTEHPWQSSGFPPRSEIQAVVPGTLHSASPASTAKGQNGTAEAVAPGRSSRPRDDRAAIDAQGDFIALSPSSYPLGDGMVVRVKLPRSAPALVGLPIPGGDVSGTVTADVVLGQDGVARAIRFVQPEESHGENQNPGLTEN
jgi:hypothetical protein